MRTLYEKPGNFSARVPSTPRSVLLKITKMYKASDAMASLFAAEAWVRLYPDDTEAATLSHTEYLYFCRAFYRVDLVYRLFSCTPDSNENEDDNSVVTLLLLSWYSSWELEQLACVVDFLNRKFVKGRSARENTRTFKSRGFLASDPGWRSAGAGSQLPQLAYCPN